MKRAIVVFLIFISANSYTQIDVIDTNIRILVHDQIMKQINSFKDKFSTDDVITYSLWANQYDVYIKYGAIPTIAKISIIDDFYIRTKAIKDTTFSSVLISNRIAEARSRFKNSKDTYSNMIITIREPIENWDFYLDESKTDKILHVPVIICILTKDTSFYEERLFVFKYFEDKKEAVFDSFIKL